MVTSRTKTRPRRPTGGKSGRPAPTRTASRPAGERLRAPATGARREAQRALAMAVLEQFRLIFRSAKKHFQWVEDRIGVGGAQLWVLAELRRRPGSHVNELAQAMAVHQSTASNLVDRLEKRGLVRRDRSSQDQRVVNLSLTQAGRKTVARAPLPLEGVLPDALKSLSREDLLGLQQRLAKLARLMKVRDSSGRRIPLAEM